MSLVLRIQPVSQGDTGVSFSSLSTPTPLNSAPPTPRHQPLFPPLHQLAPVSSSLSCFTDYQEFRLLNVCLTCAFKLISTPSSTSLRWRVIWKREWDIWGAWRRNAGRAATFVVDWALDVKDESFNNGETQRFRIMWVQFTRNGTNTGTKVRLKFSSSMAFSVKSTTSGGSRTGCRTAPAWCPRGGCCRRTPLASPAGPCWTPPRRPADPSALLFKCRFVADLHLIFHRFFFVVLRRLIVI